MSGGTYVVCDRLLNAETNRHCEFDGRLLLTVDGFWRCPACGGKHWEEVKS